MSGSVISATRYHDFSCGHRVVGHEGKCVGLHGHNYRIYFEVGIAERLDNIGRVIDFGVIGKLLGQWLEDNWDHKMLLWEKDPALPLLVAAAQAGSDNQLETAIVNSLVQVPFNPTAEEMARYLLHEVGPQQLDGTRTILSKVTVWETRKCYATATLQLTQPVTYADDLQWNQVKDAWLKSRDVAPPEPLVPYYTVPGTQSNG